MKDPVTLLEKLNDIDGDLIEEASRDDLAFAAKAEPAEEAPAVLRRKRVFRQVAALLAAAFVLSAGAVTFFVLVPTISGSRTKNAAPDVSSADDRTAALSEESLNFRNELCYVQMSYEEFLAGSDLLLVGTCTNGETIVINENTIPKSIYDDFTFTVDRVLGGEYDTSEITLRMPHKDVRNLWADADEIRDTEKGESGDPGQDESSQKPQTYREGHQYLLLIVRDDLREGTVYAFASHFLNLDLTTQSFRFPYGKPQIPDGLSLEDYSVQVFNDAKK